MIIKFEKKLEKKEKKTKKKTKKKEIHSRYETTLNCVAHAIEMISKRISSYIFKVWLLLSISFSLLFLL